ncbi:MAG: phosphoribosylformylglycinamidine synthase I [Planctomycetota bacterium]
MASPRVLILRSPGTNCDVETEIAFQQAGAVVEALHVRALCDSRMGVVVFVVLALPGGFSYGDDLGSGTILGNELRQTLFEPLKRFVEKGGLVIGICNGFQVLVKTGLLPGLSYSPKTSDDLPAATLTFNDSQRFEARWVSLRVEPNPSPFLEGAAGRRLLFPVAHGEGKFVTCDAATLQRIEVSRQVAFRYVSANGGQPIYPENPNGAQSDIAGITDESGRVLGLMPHPERHALPWQHPRWTREGLKKEGDGVFIFRNAVQYALRA